MLLEMDVLQREYISQSSPEKQNKHTHTSWGGRRRYFNEFVHVIMDSGKTEIYKTSKQAGYSGKNSRISLLQNEIDRLKTKARILC